mgnify:CR=1 FL=1
MKKLLLFLALTLVAKSQIYAEQAIIFEDVKIKEDIIWPIWQIQIEKYTPFVQYDKAVFKNILVKNFR